MGTSSKSSFRKNSRYVCSWTESAASGAPQVGTPGLNGLGTLLQGNLEGSNVNVVQELVSMIETQRAYEMNSKSIEG